MPSSWRESGTVSAEQTTDAQQVRKHLQCVQDRVFAVGDQVIFLKLQPYWQSSVHDERMNHKLSFRYFGPYKIVRKINPVVAYELELRDDPAPSLRDVCAWPVPVRPPASPTCLPARSSKHAARP
jgi:hypothetical protein